MFTGIVEEVGHLRFISEKRLVIEAKRVLESTHTGDSIAVNGVCLTAAERGRDYFAADVMAETFRRSNLSSLRAGSPVNLERAMAAQGRFGGHIVSGHIDGVGTIRGVKSERNAVWYTVAADSIILRYIVEKGSVALDGISLTVSRADKDSFAVSTIAHTRCQTTLADKGAGDTLNIECDIVGKYIERFLSFASEEKKLKNTESVKQVAVTAQMLARCGF